MGSLPGAVVGALLLGIAETMTVTYISPAWATAVPYLFIFVVLLVRPQGLMGSRLREDVARMRQPRADRRRRAGADRSTRCSATTSTTRT